MFRPASPSKGRRSLQLTRGAGRASMVFDSRKRLLCLAIRCSRSMTMRMPGGFDGGTDTRRCAQHARKDYRRTGLSGSTSIRIPTAFMISMKLFNFGFPRDESVR